MRSTHRCIALVIAVTASSFGVGSGSAWAGDDDETPKARALRLFRESDGYYQRGEFEKAVELLRESYDTYPEPLVLYNLARALEGQGDFASAVTEYERYLRTSENISDRGGIERRVATLKSYLANGKPPDSPTSPEIGPTVVPVTDDTTQRDPRRWIPWAIAGSGLVLVGVGAGVGVMSDNRHEEAQDAATQVDAARLQNEAKRLATTANVLIIGGGVVLIGGAVWGVIDWRRGKRAEAPRPGTARLQIAPAYVGVEWTLP